MSSQTQRAVAQSPGFSRTFNTRNMEYEWYLAWNHELISIVEKHKLLVAPQHILWYVEGANDVEGSKGQDDEDEGDKEQDSKEDYLNHPSDLSILTTATKLIKNSRITDFSILRVIWEV
jgi:hypothetical protein